jgi:hypothetical protein
MYPMFPRSMSRPGDWLTNAACASHADNSNAALSLYCRWIGVSREMGLTGGTASMVADTRAQWCDQALAFGEQVLSVINGG